MNIETLRSMAEEVARYGDALHIYLIEALVEADNRLTVLEAARSLSPPPADDKKGTQLDKDYIENMVEQIVAEKIEGLREELNKALDLKVASAVEGSLDNALDDASARFRDEIRDVVEGMLSNASISIHV